MSDSKPQRAHAERTGLIHHPYQPPAGFEAPQPGVFKASTVFFPSVAAMRGFEWKDKSAYTYGLHGTPTSYLLEERLCALEGARQCLLTPSGLAAISTTCLALLRSGDEILVPDNAYGPTKALVEGELRHWGITHRYYDPLSVKDLQDKLSPATRLVWLEAAGSVTLEFPDLLAMVRLCRQAGVWCVLDNTWGAGLAFSAFDLRPGGAEHLAMDISVHALTKYPSGGGDVLMGSICTADAALHLKLKLCHMRLGLGVGMNDVELVLRSLPSIALRYQAHDASTRALASWCQGRPEFAQVLHPALKDSPGHAYWRELCGDALGRAAGLFAVVIAEHFTQAQVDRFCDALQLFRIGYSWGGPVSLVVPYELQKMRTQWPADVRPGTVVRFSVGLEAVEDLQADLVQALDAMLSDRV
jgi:cystathionine beta-lyase